VFEFVFVLREWLRLDCVLCWCFCCGAVVAFGLCSWSRALVVPSHCLVVVCCVRGCVCVYVRFVVRLGCVCVFISMASIGRCHHTVVFVFCSCFALASHCCVYVCVCVCGCVRFVVAVGLWLCYYVNSEHS